MLLAVRDFEGRVFLLMHNVCWSLWDAETNTAEACRAHTAKQQRFPFPLTYAAGCVHRRGDCRRIDSPVA